MPKEASVPWRHRVPTVSIEGSIVRSWFSKTSASSILSKNIKHKSNISTTYLSVYYIWRLVFVTFRGASKLGPAGEGLNWNSRKKYVTTTPTIWNSITDKWQHVVGEHLCFKSREMGWKMTRMEIMLFCFCSRAANCWPPVMNGALNLELY